MNDVSTPHIGDLQPGEIEHLHAALVKLHGEKPQDARTLVAAAATAVRTHQWDDAIALARTALISDPRSARAWAIVGASLEGKGQWDAAIEAYESALSLDDKDLATALATAELHARVGSVSAARALTNFVILRETGAPLLRARARKLLMQLEAA
jgi:tetratricopeptide (TPR) repeat protein